MANMKERKIDVNEYRNKIFFDLIDYAHNAKRGEIVYHPGFSPNNIKRLIICPDKTVIYYYVTRKNDKNIPLDANSKQTAYPASRLFQYSQQMDYEPLISALSYKLVTTSIQEVIFCMRACNEPITLTQKEFDFNCLIKSYNNKQGSLMETIKSRYKRLGYISIFNGNYNQLKELVGQKKHKSFFIENPAIKSACVKVMPINNDDWFNNWGQNAATKDGTSGYMLDNNGSCLNAYFKTVQAKRKADKDKEEDGFEQYKIEKNKVSEKTAESFEKALDTYKKFVSCGYALLIKLQQSANSLYLDNNINATYKESVALALLEVPIYKAKETDKKYGITFTKGSNDISAEERAKNNIELLKEHCQSVYEILVKALCDNMISNTNQLKQSYMFEVVLDNFDNVLKPTPALSSYANSNQFIGKLFKGEKLKDSMANVCYLTSLLYLSKRTDKEVNECFNKDYWYNKL